MKVVLAAIIVSQDNLIFSQRAAPLRAAIAGHSREQIRLRCSSEISRKGWRPNKVPAWIGRIEVTGPSRRMRVAGDHSHHRNLDANGFDEPVQCCRKCVAENCSKFLNGFDRRFDRTSLFNESFTKEQQSPGCEICFRFDLLPTILGKSVFIVTECRIVMPGNDAVTNFVRLVPAALYLGKRPIEKNPFPIGKIEGLERGLPDRVDDQRWPPVDLDSRHADTAERLAYNVRIIGSVECTIDL